jgi:hypothetical protein
VQGISPKEMTPNLFKQARYKRRSVRYEMNSYSWIRNIQSINSFILIQKFVMLFVALQLIELSDINDEIT